MQIEVWERPTYPNEWVHKPAVDVRLTPLVEVMIAIANASDCAADVPIEPDEPVTPLDLAEWLRRVAADIERLTRDDQLTL